MMKNVENCDGRVFKIFFISWLCGTFPVTGGFSPSASRQKEQHCNHLHQIHHRQELRTVVNRLEEAMNTAKDELNTTMKLIAKVHWNLSVTNWWRCLKRRTRSWLWRNKELRADGRICSLSRLTPFTLSNIHYYVKIQFISGITFGN